MIYEQKYIKETEYLINFYQDKKAQSVKEYILTCHRYINELRNIDVIGLVDELEYGKLFMSILALVEETFRPDEFVSVIDGTIVRYLDEEFMIYFIGVQSQLRKPIRWNMLIDLQLKFSVEEIKFNISTGFSEDFTQYAISKIKLTDLFNSKI